MNPRSSAMLCLLLSCSNPGESRPPASTVDATGRSSSIQSQIDRTLQAIHEDLRALAHEHPQLANITSARIEQAATSGAEFRYQKGVGPETVIKARDPKFERDGCMICVEILAYDPQQNRELADMLAKSARAWVAYELPDGSRYAVWSLAIAESNESGRRFCEQVRALIQVRLTLLKDGLQAKQTTEGRQRNG